MKCGECGGPAAPSPVKEAIREEEAKDRSFRCFLGWIPGSVFRLVLFCLPRSLLRPNGRLSRVRTGQTWGVGQGLFTGQRKYLLVLADGSPANYEACYLDLDRKEIGLPSFDPSKYTPFSHSALVDEAALEGYPVIGTLAADWRIGEHAVGVRITGAPPEVQKADPIGDPEEFYHRTMPVAYKTEVVLTKFR
jgi:hypothetical protein